MPNGGGAKGGAIVRLYQNGGYDESLSMRILSCVINVINVYMIIKLLNLLSL